MEPTIQSYIEAYKGKPTNKLQEDEIFWKHLVEAPIEKFVKVVFIKGIKGRQYGSLVESSIRDRLAYDDKYEEEEEIALGGLADFFENLNLETRTSISYRWPSSSSVLEVTFSSYVSIPEKASYIVDNAHVALAILEWIVGERSISSSTMMSIVENISKFE
ncbi:hypothetical protein O6H91_15G035000 [Diphasiastrum complanatum]|nr:hypothetical protein O6H91_15G035000 [Diphasiastrum complanatum]